MTLEPKPADPLGRRPPSPSPWPSMESFMADLELLALSLCLYPKEKAMTDDRMGVCTECGMALGDAGEFHPSSFCVWKKAGRDPWPELLWIVERLGLDTAHWPKQPPLVRDLRSRGGSQVPDPPQADPQTRSVPVPDGAGGL